MLNKMNLGQEKRPVTTLFMLSSVDGKISTGASDNFDFDKDIPTLLGVNGVQQYYDLEKETDLWTLCSGRTLEKVYKQNPVYKGEQLPVTCVVIDSVHLSQECYNSLCRKFERVIIATNNSRFLGWAAHPEVLEYSSGMFHEIFTRIKR